jgi:CubicO group peptidase (beta-lactamase class C family)
MTLIPLPTQPAGVAWPTDAWPEGEVDKAHAAAVERRLAYAFAPEAVADLGETHAVVVIQRGRLIAERYADGFGPDQTYPSWSMAKSITQALTGLLVGDGRLDVRAPTPAPEWRAAGDPRAAITLDLLLRMSSGLAFVEDYEPDHPSDVIAMLFGEGKADVAHFAARQPLAQAPGTFWSYSSGTTNIVSRALSQALDAYGPDFEAFMRQRLFEPLGMASASPKFDAAGTFIGSSYCFCTARDFARFGLLYLRDGVWAGRRLLPEGWVDYARTPTWQQPNDEGPYGAHWWLGMAGPGSFSANGYEGQYTAVIPDLDMVIVRHGRTPLDRKPAAKAWVGALAQAFRD